MKLGKVSLTPRVPEGKYRVTVPPHINEKLLAYVTLYKEVHREEIDPEVLILGIVDQFLESDSDFRSWLKNNASAPTAALAATPTRRQRRSRTAPESASDSATDTTAGASDATRNDAPSHAITG